MVFRGQALGKYKILEPLGSGGFGTVYLAEDTWIDKRVALKVPHRQNLDFGELLREPRLLASLNHPNIVTVMTAEKQDNVFFIVMEYVPGETLEDLIVAKGPLDLASVLDYTCQIANAVEHAHKQGVIHRDLRPANVFVTDKAVVKVGDFGTSRFLEMAAHGTTVIGSPPYMAPEQFEGRAVFASDIYSLGVTMYQMLTGELPYGTPSPADLDRLRRGEMASPPRLRNPQIPDRRRRHRDARALRADFRSLSAGRGLPAGHPAGAAGTAAAPGRAHACAGRRRRRRKSGSGIGGDSAARPGGASGPGIATASGRAAHAGRAHARARCLAQPLLLAVQETAAGAQFALPLLWRNAVEFRVEEYGNGLRRDWQDLDASQDFPVHPDLASPVEAHCRIPQSEILLRFSTEGAA